MSYTAEPKQQDTNIKVPLISKIAYGMGDVGCNFSWMFVGNFLMMDFPVSGSWPTVYRPSHRPSFLFRIFPSPFARLFGMVSAPFDNEQYRNQGNKAIGKPNCYQKVIICPSEPCRLIFVYGDAIFALPEAFFFGYSGAIFERLKVSFH